MEMLPVVASKSLAVNEATPLVEPSAAALTPVMVRPVPITACSAVTVMPLEEATVPVALLYIEVPLPESRPPKVVEPVPPFATPNVPVRYWLMESDEVAMTAPVALVESSAEVRPVMPKAVVVAPVAFKLVAKRLVVVALVPVALAKTKLPVRVVEAEERPPLKAMRVVVAFEGNGYAAAKPAPVM